MAGFRTELTVASSLDSIDHQSGVLTIGSCFSDTIGNALVSHKFRALVNPFGTVYNPISIHRLLQRSAHDVVPGKEELIQNGNLWVHPDYHSRFNNSSAEFVIENIRTATHSAYTMVRGCKTIVITYGTAKVFELASTGEVVANCHKLPGRQFRQRLLSVEEIETDFKNLYPTLRKLGVQQFILTVSPVRHLSDTLEINSVSKSVLRLACHRMSSAGTDITYFPAYEIMMDDLRDYRFYASDMIHPSEVAGDYIWEKFSSAYFSKATQEVIAAWKDLSKALQHRPFHPESAGHLKFLRDVQSKLKSLSTQIDVSEELQSLESQLNQP